MTDTDDPARAEHRAGSYVLGAGGVSSRTSRHPVAGRQRAADRPASRLFSKFYHRSDRVCRRAGDRAGQGSGQKDERPGAASGGRALLGRHRPADQRGRAGDPKAQQSDKTVPIVVDYLEATILSKRVRPARLNCCASGSYRRSSMAKPPGMTAMTL